MLSFRGQNERFDSDVRQTTESFTSRKRNSINCESSQLIDRLKFAGLTVCFLPIWSFGAARRTQKAHPSFGLTAASRTVLWGRSVCITWHSGEIRSMEQVAYPLPARRVLRWR